MRDAALLTVWLIGLFGLIGCVMAAVARFVKKDSMKYDKQFTWQSYPSWESKRTEGTTTKLGLSDN
ncbi:hypothetical protein [Cohnella herbarum]|uniref:Uncharacterized protein n=1 Tax=Cohnella herbarum TaxID=2728023 RepID=A0A7Z2VEZ2_9BACL|nr:hypothetical protein [Cohnella herbarum]QJD81715.1 hypothetical protein HH215_10335 [Cohnella herbarum]